MDFVSQLPTKAFIVGSPPHLQIHMKSESNKKHIHKAVREGCKTLQFYQNSPRMVPRHLQPQLHKMHFQVDEFDPLLGKTRSRSSSKGKEKQGRLSFGLPLPKKSRQILTDRELVQWTEKYALPEKEAGQMAHRVRSALSPGLLCSAHMRQKGGKDKRPAEVCACVPTCILPMVLSIFITVAL